MDKAGVRQIGVVDGTDEKTLVGLLTMSDIVRSHAQAAVEAGDPDKTLPELVESKRSLLSS